MYWFCSLFFISSLLAGNDCPYKEKLDAFFSQNRHTFNEKSMKKAGFDEIKIRKFTRLIVTRHPDFAGLIFKLYLDTQRYYKGVPEEDNWKARIKGITGVRQIVEKKGWQPFFKIPQKWLYELPSYPKCPSGYLEKKSILVEEDVGLVSSQENKRLWKSNFITFEHLEHLYTILSSLELRDCSKIHNIPITKDGRIAFIDTQSFEAGEVDYSQLNEALNEVNKNFWMQLTHQE